MKLKIILFLCCIALINQNITVFADNTYSQWAEESITKSINVGLIPESLQCKYTDKITRQEFCHLAVQTYLAKTNSKIDMTVKTPFKDVDDIYITTAYNLKIVSGTGNNNFSPSNGITRQEAAVMLNNLAYVLGIDTNTPKTEKFIDEEYFAAWAKKEIYSITGIKSGNTFVMTGTEQNKFSPWMNYTREQAIATIWRLYNCKGKELFYDGQYLQLTNETEKIYGSWLYYTVSKLDYKDKSDNNPEIITDLVRIKKDGSDREILVSNKYSINFAAIINDYLYYVLFDKDSRHTCYKMKLDKSETTEISQDELDNISQNIRKTAHNEKYNFFVEIVPFDGKTFSLYLTKSDLNGENKERLYSRQIHQQIILYDNYVYFISDNELIVDGASKFTKDIMRVDFNGNAENLTQNNKDSLDIAEIVKIEDNTIFYKREPVNMPENNLNSDFLYSMHIDGSNDKLIY